MDQMIKFNRDFRHCPTSLAPTLLSDTAVSSSVPFEAETAALMTQLRQCLNRCLEGIFTNQEPTSVPGAPALDGLKFAVCGPGDRDYIDSCGMGKRFDTRLEELGWTRMISRADCDVDFEETAGAWGSELLADLGGTSATPSAVSNSPAAKTGSFSKKNPSRLHL